MSLGVYAQNFSYVKSMGSQQKKSDLRLNLKNLKQVGEVDERYQSFNVEMCEIVGGKFWIPYDLLDSTHQATLEGFDALKRSIAPINLYQKKLRALTSALGPTYIRVSGTWANTVYFQNNDDAKLSKAPEGYENVLTRKEWKGVIDFCKAVDGKLVTSFPICNGIRNSNGIWTPVEMKPLVDYTKSVGGDIVAAEMFNEPSHARYGGAPKSYDAECFAKDFAEFRKYAKSVLPGMKIVGPGSTGEGGLFPIEKSMASDKIFKAIPKPEFDIFSYHYYGGASKRCSGNLSPEHALTKEWLSRTEVGLQYYEELRNKYQPGAPIWLTETAEAACGGDPWAATYVDCFRYLEQLGRLAKKGVKVVMHNTIASSEYALLDQDTHNPRPNYWAALLWNKLMGTKVFDSGVAIEGADIFIHNLKNSSHGLAVLVVNPSGSAFTVDVPAEAEQYLFTADKLLTKTVKLNGEVLKLNADDTLPKISGKKIKAGTVQLPAHGILFLSFQSLKR
jgi:Glycosyl hydrolase family 79, N-terminal domain.